MLRRLFAVFVASVMLAAHVSVAGAAIPRRAEPGQQLSGAGERASVLVSVRDDGRHGAATDGKREMRRPVRLGSVSVKPFAPFEARHRRPPEGGVHAPVAHCKRPAARSAPESGDSPD